MKVEVERGFFIEIQSFRAVEPTVILAELPQTYPNIEIHTKEESDGRGTIEPGRLLDDYDDPSPAEWVAYKLALIETDPHEGLDNLESEWIDQVIPETSFDVTDASSFANLTPDGESPAGLITEPYPRLVS